MWRDIGLLKTAICDFQRRSGEWTSKCDIRGTSIIVSLKRDEILQVSRLTSGENFVNKRKSIYIVCVARFLASKQIQEQGCEYLGVLATVRATWEQGSSGTRCS